MRIKIKNNALFQVFKKTETISEKLSGNAKKLMKKLEDFDQKTISKVLFRTGWLSIILPFAISAAFNYLPFWIALPTGMILTVFLLIFVFTFFYFLPKKISKE